MAAKSSANEQFIKNKSLPEVYTPLLYDSIHGNSPQYTLVGDIYNTIYVPICRLPIKSNKMDRIKQKLSDYVDEVNSNIYEIQIGYNKLEAIPIYILQQASDDGHDFSNDILLDNIPNILRDINDGNLSLRDIDNDNLSQKSSKKTNIVDFYANTFDINKLNIPNVFIPTISLKLEQQELNTLDPTIFDYDHFTIIGIPSYDTNNNSSNDILSSSLNSPPPLLSMSPNMNNMNNTNNTNNTNDDEEESKYESEPESVSDDDINYILSKVVFDENVNTDKTIKNAIKHILHSNYTVISSIWPVYPIRDYGDNYNESKSVIIVCKVKTNSDNSNLQILVENHQKLRDKPICYKITNDVKAGETEINTLSYLNQEYEFVDDVPTLYPSTITKISHCNTVKAVMYGMTLYQTDLCAYIEAIKRFKYEPLNKPLSCSKLIQLKIGPIYDAANKAAEIQYKTGRTHSDFKLKNIFLKIYHEKEPVRIDGIDGNIKMRPFKVVLGDWGLCQTSNAMKRRSGYNATLIGSKSYLPNISTEKYNVKKLLSLQVAMTMVEAIDYTKMLDVRRHLMGNKYDKWTYHEDEDEDEDIIDGQDIIKIDIDDVAENEQYDMKYKKIMRSLFHDEDNEINKGITHLLINSVIKEEQHRLSIEEFLEDDFFYIEETKIAQTFIDDLSEHNLTHLQRYISLKCSTMKQMHPDSILLNQMDYVINQKNDLCDLQHILLSK